MQIKTACPLDCWDVCSIVAHVEEGEITKLEGNPDHPITQGFLCGKGRRLKDRQAHAERILYPQKRVDGVFQRISWDQAYTEITAHIQNAIQRHGHHSILHAYDWGSGAVLKNLNQRFFYELGGCTETVGSLCWEAGLEAQRYDFGQARSHGPADILHARKIVVWGRNVAHTNVHMMPFLKRAQEQGAQLIVVNPLPTDLDGRAQHCITPRPGSDGALALGALRICVQQGWIDETFVRDHSVGWEQFLGYIQQFTEDTVQRLTDVTPDDQYALAAAYGQPPTTTLLGMGMQRYQGGGNAIRAIDALVAATGQVGRVGGGVQYANRWMTEFIDQDALSGRADADVREFSRGTQAADILAATPAIDVLFVTRTNPVTQVPDAAELVRAYEQIPHKIVIDMFMTPTAQLADYVLPCTSVLEEEDFTFSTLWHPILAYIQPVVAARGEAKSDRDIFADLSERLGIGGELSKPVDYWLQRALAPLQSQGLSLAQMKETGFLEIPLDAVPWRDFQFRTPSGKYEFVSEVARADGHASHATYLAPTDITLAAHGNQMKLGTTRKRRQWSESVETGDQQPWYNLLTVHPRLSQNSQYRDITPLPPYPTVEITSVVAEEMGLTTGDFAVVANEQSEVVAIVKVVNRGHARTIKMESGWSGQGQTINFLTKAHQADFGRQTAQYDCVVQLYPLSVADVESLHHTTTVLEK